MNNATILTKSIITTRILPVALAILLICSYQLYWLINEYDELYDQFRENIQETLRSSDFEELTHRVEEISRMQYQGRVNVSMGYDHDRKNSLVKSEISADEKPVEQQNNHMTVSPASFSSILKNPEDLKRIGLNMQRGIHSAIDGIKEIDLNYLDSTLTDKLCSLGLDGKHRLLYLKQNPLKNTADTLEQIGNLNFRPTDIFSLEISTDSEYAILVPQWRIAVLKKMAPVILFSAFTLILLIMTFWYMIHMMRRQRQLEEIKDNFTSNITHELKTPIAVAYAATDSLLNYDASHNTPRMNRYLTVCQEQLRLLARLVEQILSLSVERRQSLILNYEDVMVRELIESIVSAFLIKNSANATFKIDADENLTLTTDRMHLSNIIGNLIDNAIKYSHGHAEVKLKAFRNSKGQVIIKVTDRGIGITREQQKLIFDKFYRVPHGSVLNVKGYGLGLFYVRSMAENLGATVEVKSVYGKGSSFILKFK